MKHGILFLDRGEQSVKNRTDRTDETETETE